MEYNKDFDNWNKCKKELEQNTRIPPFREREIWWYAAGENIGTEIGGKNEQFSRPILIVRKYGAESFFGIPLSSQIHDGRWFTPVMVKGSESRALLSQSGSFSAKRLLKRMSKASVGEFTKICSSLQELLFKK